MKMSIVPYPETGNQRLRGSWATRFARSMLLRQLAKISDGQLRVVEGEQSWSFGQASSRIPKPVTVTINDPCSWTLIAMGGVSSAGEGYMNGDWTCNDLTMLVRLFVRNRSVMEAMESRLGIVTRAVRRAFYWAMRNTPAGSRRNISAHYDIGNDLFGLFLDSRMMYSSAFYATPDMSLEAAAQAKLDRVCCKLGLSPHTHLLEVGTGWGGLAIHAAQHYGCRVTTTTISEEQYRFARQRVREAGLADKVEVLLEDYRNLQGQYDRIVSIEMIEAVGHQYMKQYFAKCSHLLKPDGMMLLQAITISDQQYHRAVKEVDFIKRFIFPGGFLPSVTAMADAVTAATDMKLSHMEDIGLHYAQTLRDWRQRFLGRLDEVRALGYSERFIRLWDFYLCYSEGGFAERYLGTVQMLLTKTDALPSDVRY